MSKDQVIQSFLVDQDYLRVLKEVGKLNVTDVQDIVSQNRYRRPEEWSDEFREIKEKIERDIHGADYVNSQEEMNDKLREAYSQIIDKRLFAYRYIKQPKKQNIPERTLK